MLVPAPARLLAAHRAREHDRADAVFRDPYARALVGEPDVALARVLEGRDATDWLFTARTRSFDRIVLREGASADLVVNLGAGLDTRPYRLQLPPALRWADVDAPEVLDYKARVLEAGGGRPSCAVERHPVDLSNPDARRGLFRDLARSASRVLVVSESLLIHLMSADVRELADDIGEPATFERWITDIVSPSLLDMLKEQSGEIVREAGAPYLFAPWNGPQYLDREPWHVAGVQSLMGVALKLERLPIALRVTALLRESEPWTNRPWAGTCLLGKQPLQPRVE